MATTADTESGFARLSAILGPCAHPAAVPAGLLTGEVVAVPGVRQAASGRAGSRSTVRPAGPVLAEVLARRGIRL